MASQVFNRVQLAFRSSQLNTAGPLFGTKSLFNVKLFWNAWYFIKYLKSTKGRQKKIPHCNIYILRSPGSGLNDGAWEWKRQRGNTGITLWDSRVINRNPPHTRCLAGWRTSFGTRPFHIQFIRSSLLSSPRYLVSSQPTVHPRSTRGTLVAARRFFPHYHWDAVWDMLERTCEYEYLCFLPYYCTKQHAGFQRISRGVLG